MVPESRLRVTSQLLLLLAASLVVLNDKNVSAFLLPQPSRTDVVASHLPRQQQQHLSKKKKNHLEAGGAMMRMTADTTTTALIEEEKPEILMMKEEEEAAKSKQQQQKGRNGLLSNPEKLEEMYPNFPRTWIPLGSTTELDPDRPNPVQFLEQEYVTYYNNITDNWVVMDDTCPHRLAPLREGRVEPTTRQLQCSYHGWTFEPEEGSCVTIPQMNPDAFVKSVFQNVRSYVESYTTHTDPTTGIIWIWPWKQDPLQFASDEWRHPEGMMKNIFGLDGNSITTTEVVTYTRDQPYGWDTLVENLIDPSHIPFAHHGMQGKRDDAIPINMTLAVDNGESGFAFEWEDRTMGQFRSGLGEFRSPFVINYDATFQSPSPTTAVNENDQDEKKEKGRPFRLAVLCIPTKPGWSRVIVFNVKQSSTTTKATASKDSNDDDDVAAVSTQANARGAVEAASKNDKKKKKKKKGSLMATLFKIIPTWVSHLLSNKFFNSDLAFLHYQEQARRRRRRGPNNNKNNMEQLERGDSRYFMPAECDRSIVALHTWLGRYAKSYLQQQSMKLPPAIYDRKQLFDHYSQHTTNCKICLQALAGIKKWKRRSQWTLALSIVLGYRHWPARILAVACLGAMKVMTKIEGAFYEGEFKHYENH